MKNILFTSVFFLISRAIKSFSTDKEHGGVDHLKISMFYIKSIETMRLLFLGMVGIGLCLMFLLSGIVLLHVVIFVYMPWSAETKIAIGLGCAAFYIVLAVSAFIFLSSQTKWLKIFHADKIWEYLNKIDHDKSD
jgi:hypothetical protein